MLIYYDFDTAGEAETKLAEIKAAGGLAYVLTYNEHHHQVREIKGF